MSSTKDIRSNEVRSTSIRRGIVPGFAVLALALSACGGQSDGATDGDSVSGSVAVDGSSTVFPLSNAAAELLNEENPDIKVTVGESGTGGGFEVFCADKTDISDASRPIEDDEIAACKSAGVEYTELRVATDALTVVVNKDLAIDCLTTEQLKKIWEPAAEGKVSNWNQVDPSFPDEKISLFGPGTDSGTFDYFTGEINGEEGASRTDYEATEDDNVTVQGVSGTPGAMGYFGFSYFEENADTLKAVSVDSGSGCVAPSAETAQDGTYTPLARPLFVYVNNASYSDKPQVKAFVDFYIDNLPGITEAAKFIALNDEQNTEVKSALDGMSS
ncbi:Phosphate transport system substrate-binding protein [metagenome]|uniref:Phosphate transport system substrate-binding protein n=1 Tax=metagenome TaxID=256318 RepID=A0A2P2BXY8_9ZZZZ